MAIEVDVERVGTTTIAKLAGRLDGSTSSDLDQALGPLVTQGSTLLLDLINLAYVSSAGLRIFLKAAKQAKAANARLALCGINPAVLEVFDISGFTAIFTIFPDRDHALSALN